MWPPQKTRTWAGFSIFSGRREPSATIQAVQEEAGAIGPHQCFGTSCRPIGSGPDVSDVGHGALHACPLYAVNGIKIPSRRRTPSVNVGLAAASSRIADNTTNAAAQTKRRTTQIVRLLVEDFANL